MSFLARAPVLYAAAALVWGCSVYDQDLRSNEDGLGSGASGNANGGGGSAGTGGSMVTGGTGADTAGSSAQGGSGATGGTDVAPEGGSGNEAGETSVGGEDSGAAGGSSAGSGGTGGDSGGSAGKASTGGGGTGGSAPVAKCSEHPLTAKTSWIASGWPTSPGNGTEADPLYNPPSHVHDGSLNERWSTGAKQVGGEWLQIDFTQEVSLKQLIVQVLSENGGNGNDYPRGYEIRLSNTPPLQDGTPNFTPPVRASGAGAANSNLTLNFPSPISGRYLSIRQTGVATGTEWWTVSELNANCLD